MRDGLQVDDNCARATGNQANQLVRYRIDRGHVDVSRHLHHQRAALLVRAQHTIGRHTTGFRTRHHAPVPQDAYVLNNDRDLVRQRE
ncbi:hypothetical protein GCM10022267_86790 [Lentzea roselyniae]|uniref:Uncharacterized protein n=1 Tax=Lentzea roselyniae TaxID=531940 RepID=A0ABP7CG00_9PSEU